MVGRYCYIGYVNCRKRVLFIGSAAYTDTGVHIFVGFLSWFIWMFAPFIRRDSSYWVLVDDFRLLNFVSPFSYNRLLHSFENIYMWSVYNKISLSLSLCILALNLPAACKRSCEALLLEINPYVDVVWPVSLMLICKYRKWRNFITVKRRQCWVLTQSSYFFTMNI